MPFVEEKHHKVGAGRQFMSSSAQLEQELEIKYSSINQSGFSSSVLLENFSFVVKKEMISGILADQFFPGSDH